MYVSEDYEFNNFEDKNSLVWRSDDIELGDWTEDRVVDLSIKPSKVNPHTPDRLFVLKLRDKDYGVTQHPRNCGRQRNEKEDFNESELSCAGRMKD